MGAGEFISVRSQRELLAASTPAPSAGAALSQLDVNANELALVYRARGMSADAAEQRAQQVLASQQVDAGLRETDNPVNEELVGTGMGAALSSFCFFASGAVVPVLPFLAGLSGGSALLLASALVGLALMLTGAIVGVLSGGPPLRRALRQLAIGAAAAAVTYAVGMLFGATVG
jgi:VIT1/CCC1 family predicted Fe2+/Mn2+ transporter